MEPVLSAFITSQRVKTRTTRHPSAKRQSKSTPSLHDNTVTRTSHARHWIIVSLSRAASFSLPQRQNSPAKFFPYALSSLGSSGVLCKVHACARAVVEQSQRKRRLGKSSSCSWSVWHAMEQATDGEVGSWSWSWLDRGVYFPYPV